MKDKKSLGLLIKKAREEKNLSQSELSKKIHVTRQAISRWENGLNVPDAGVWEEICRELSLDENLLNEFFEDTDVEKFENVMAQELKRIKGKYLVLPIFLFLLILVGIIFLTGVVINRNKFQVYKLSIETDDFSLDNGLVVFSSVGNYFQLGKLRSSFLESDEDKIIRVKIYTIDNEENRLIYETDYEDNISFKEDYGYDEYFKDIDNVIDNLFVDVTVLSSGKSIIYTLVLKMEKLMENDKLFYFKNEAIGEEETLNEEGLNNVEISTSKLTLNGYIYKSKNNDYRKVEDNRLFSYTNFMNNLVYWEKQEFLNILISYNIKIGIVHGTIFDNKKDDFVLDFCYYVDEKRVECTGEYCDDYSIYLNIIMNEYKKLI